MWPGLCWPISNCHPYAIQTRSGSCKSCHGLSDGYRNSSDLTARLSELTEQSPVRAVIEEVIRTLVSQLGALEKQLRSIVRTVMPCLLELPGVGAVVAGTLLAEVGDPQRFPTADHFASYCGVAPVERGSGQNSRMQVNPGGNRRLNWALHIIAMVRLRVDDGHSRQFITKQTDQGKTKRAALRSMKTYIAREIFKTIRRSYPDRRSPAA